MKLNWIERDEYAYAAIRLDWVAVRFEVFFKSNCAYLFGVKELGPFDTIKLAKAACEAEWERMKAELTGNSHGNRLAILRGLLDGCVSEDAFRDGTHKAIALELLLALNDILGETN